MSLFTVTEFDILRAAHRFLRNDSDGTTSWNDQLAKKYYNSLYREFAICDLKHYRSGNFALRWRTESEVLDGTGETSCANARCERHRARSLSTLELPFAYEEHGEHKEALVKVVPMPKMHCTLYISKSVVFMSPPTAALQPVERQDIHKSCGTIESLLSALNDYCEAASAFAARQKKLSKALRDAAGLKTNAQFAANAFGASAVILEAVADVGSKFAKIAEKESHSVSAEVRKWFKKLAKVEKAHEERMNKSNARIKQAGQTYEEKSKKSAKDAREEHARYISLLSVIGPEMSQEKYHHAVNVTRQNTSVTFNVAASLSRIADAEWTRTCESMRRIAPTIGPLGEWRSLCEGSWTGPLPDDLPALSTQAPVPPAVSEWGQTGPVSPVQASATSLDPPRSPFSAATQNQGSINSITTLSAFPFPPTHFSVPLAMNETELQPQQTFQYAHSRAGSPNPARSQDADSLNSLHPPQTQSPSDLRSLEPPPRLALSSEDKEFIKPIGDPKKPRRPSLITRVPPPSDKSVRPVSPFKRAEYPSVEKEFGLHSESNQRATKSHSVDAAKKHLERTESTHSTGSNVAALRNRYTQTVEMPSQGPKDIPRLPMSVSEIASRYQPIDEPLPPRRTVSPIMDRFPPDTSTRTSPREREERIKESTELERKEYELGQCERDRSQFFHSRPEPGNATDGPKGPRNSNRPFQHKRGSKSVTHFNVPLTTTSSSGQSLLPTKDHAPFCGCDTCSVSKYKATDLSPSPRDLRPPEPPILLRPEKPKGWIRRLSMPSVNMSFSLDAKKNASALSLKAGLPLPAENGQLGKQSFEQGPISNRTVAGIGR
ncbi:folate-sensitive fragile site protein Fra10Ac1-domain-containing protein [Butyriboletus roseoflavus]|nr:folate-sensitive fragile site protein Fra10Ac1-domain-containing protein [Butyriboletus roseoflavus]